MTTTAIVTIIVVLLVLGVAASAYIQYKEQLKAQKRQQIAKYRFRAREGQEIYDRFDEYPIGSHAKRVILQYIAQNLNQALALDPSQSDIKQSLEEIHQKLNSPEIASNNPSLSIPSDAQEIIVLMGRIKSLMRYIHRIGKTPGVEISTASKALANLKKLYMKFQTHTYFSIARKSAYEKNFIHAMQFLENAKKSLLKQNIADPETQKILSELESFEQEIQSMRNMSKNKIPEEKENKPDLNETDDLFQPKKKW
jgi:hypothetical protein